jgi:hypothetical protein
MADTTTSGGAGAPAGPGEPGAPDPGRRDRGLVVLPTVTFLVGLLLGGVLVWVSGLGNGDDESAANGDAGSEQPDTPADTATDGQSPDRTVVIPGSCVEAAQRAQEVLDLVQQFAAAARDLDARQLQTLVDRMQDLDPLVRDAATSCQEDAGVSSGTSSTTG